MELEEIKKLLKEAFNSSRKINIISKDDWTFLDAIIVRLDLENNCADLSTKEDGFFRVDVSKIHTIQNTKEEYSQQEQLIIEKCDDLKELLIRKNRDYGNSAEKSFNKWGHKAFMIRIEDKMNRLENLIKNGENNLVKDESLYDTVLDLAGYELLWMVELTKKGESSNE